jgi:hypothetical protein
LERGRFLRERGFVLHLKTRTFSFQNQTKIESDLIRLYESGKVHKMIFVVFQLMLMIVVANGNRDRPVLQPISVPNEILAGQKFKLGCVMSSGSLPVTFHWSKDNLPLQSSTNVMIRHVVEDYSELIVQRISPDDVGKYKCSAKNSAGEDQSQIDVQVKGKVTNELFDGLIVFD